MINRKIITDKKLQYICELKIDGKIIDKMETDDYEVWYDKVTERVYEVSRFRKIEILIKICNL